MSEKVGELYYDVVLETRALIAEARKVEDRLRRIADKGAGVQASLTKMAAAVSAAIGAIAIDGFVSKLVNTQRQFDVMFASLKTMTGGADQAGAAFERLRKFAAQTPYTLEQSVQGFTKLKALGIDPSERAMTSFGNTSAAMGKDLSQMIEAVADASTSEFERLKEFGIKAKQEGDKVSLTFQGVTTTIGNNSAEITEYLTKIGETNFAGAMSERMKTLDGDISNLQDSIGALYLQISQSGVGDVIAQGVRKASEAIQEMTTSVKEGGLTEYFEGLRPYVTAAEVAVVSLAGAITGRLVASFIAAATQAYASATAIGAATVAARGFSAVLAALGGPVGIAVTGLALLALNWDKVGGKARDAATMSEEAAERIKNALQKSQGRAATDLAKQLAEVKDEIAGIDKELGRTGANMADPAQLKELKERRAVLAGIAEEIKKAADTTHGGAGRGKVNPDVVTPKAEGSSSTGRADTKVTKQPEIKFDSAAYVASLEAAALEGVDRVNAIEQEGLRRNQELLNSGKISADQAEQAKTLITEKATSDRQDIQRAAGEEYRQYIEETGEKEKKLLKEANDYAEQLTKAVNPIEALRQEYEAKLQLVTQYEQLMAMAGVDATEQGLMARTQMERQYELQRAALAEQTFRSQSDANAFLIDSLNALSSSATSSIVGLINGTVSAQEAMRGLANTVLNEAVGALVQIGVQQIKNALAAKTVEAAEKARAAASGAVYAASVSAQVAGMSALAAQNAFAATAAIPMVGPALAPAAAAAAGAAAAAIGSPAIATAPLAGARQYGGPVNAGGLYRVGEGGKPEMFQGSSGRQYMIPGEGGKVVSNADMMGGAGGAGWTINVNNMAAGVSVTPSVDEQSRTITLAVTEVANQISNNSGQVWSALRGASNVQGRMS